jgi:hypothetical protein
MDPVKITATCDYVEKFFVNDDTEICWVNRNIILIISINPFKLIKRISRSTLKNINDIKYFKSDNSFILVTDSKDVIHFDPRTRQHNIMAKLPANSNNIVTSPDGKFIVYDFTDYKGNYISCRRVRICRGNKQISSIEITDKPTQPYISERSHRIDKINNDGTAYYQNRCGIYLINLLTKEIIAQYGEDIPYGSYLPTFSSDAMSIYIYSLAYDDIMVLDATTLKIKNKKTVVIPFGVYWTIIDGNYLIKVTKNKIFLIDLIALEIKYEVQISEISEWLQENVVSVNMQVCNNFLFVISPDDETIIYDIVKDKFINRIKAERGYLLNNLITPDSRYLITQRNKTIMRLDLTQLQIDKQKRTLLAAENIPDNPVYRFTHDRLYDWHLMGEIFKFLPKI